MNKDIFVFAIKKLLALQTEENIKNWIEWTQERVFMKHYIGYGSMPQNKEVEEWLDSYYSEFSNIKSELGRDAAVKVLNLSQERLCLYPNEMWAGARVLYDGGTRMNIIQMKFEGTLESEDFKAPAEDSNRNKPDKTDVRSYDIDDLRSMMKIVYSWKEEPEIPLPFRKAESLVGQLINACMELLKYRYEITTISKSDYDLISEHAFYLVNSRQVLEPDDVGLDAIYECFNDAKVTERMVESEDQEQLEEKSSISGKAERKR